MPRIIKRGLVILVFCAASVGILHHYTKDNRHTVIEGEIYRSAQLPIKQAEQYWQQKGIKTVINLRGSHPARQWYQEEITLAQKMGIEHYDLAFNAHKMPSTQQLNKLTELLKTSPRPILVHCMAGADRTGLASAIALILDGRSLEEATKQFSLFYWVTAFDSVGKQVFADYRKWLKQRGLEHHKELFYTWMMYHQALS